MRRLGTLLALCLLACGGGEGGPLDAADTDDTSTADVLAIDAVAVDAAPACTGAPYDQCTDDTQCQSGTCHLFTADQIRCCTQACDDQNPCPTLDGEDAFCNNIGICKPPGQRACTPQ